MTQQEILDYAKKIAIAFKEWNDEDLEGDRWQREDDGETWEPYGSSQEWICPVTREVKLTDQLFDKFVKDTKLNIK